MNVFSCSTDTGLGSCVHNLKSLLLLLRIAASWTRVFHFKMLAILCALHRVQDDFSTSAQKEAIAVFLFSAVADKQDVSIALQVFGHSMFLLMCIGSRSITLYHKPLMHLACVASR